jgi:hypothetical protein
MDDAFQLYDFAMVGRETIEGHETVVVTMTPKPNATARTRMGGMLRHFKGRAWISEHEHELVKLEVEAIDDMSLGWGVLARVHKGTEFTFQRRKVNGETWLPARSSYRASARVLLLRRMRVASTSEYSNYRKFSVATDASFGLTSSR